jgi:chemotaxis protein CheX
LLLKESTSDLLESTVASVKEVLTGLLNIEEPHIYNEKTLQSEMCVLVGFAGEIEGRMLHSFIGEIANMLAGNICTLISQKGWEVDITPPTIPMGEMKLFGYVFRDGAARNGCPSYTSRCQGFHS